MKIFNIQYFLRLTGATHRLIVISRMLKKSSSFVFQDTAASPKTRPAHHLAGVHKRAMPYSHGVGLVGRDTARSAAVYPVKDVFRRAGDLRVKR